MKNLGRRDFLKLLVSGLFVLLPACARPLRLKVPIKSKVRRFVFCTDLHARKEWQVPNALILAAREINSEDPDFVICGGDLISDGLSVSSKVAEDRWQVVQDFLAELKGNFFSVLGNHDLSLPELSSVVDDASFQREARGYFLTNTGQSKSYQILDFGDLVFVLLDSLEVLREPVIRKGVASFYRGHVSDEQIEWLSSELLKFSEDKRFIIVSHIPLRSNNYRDLYPTEILPPTQFVDNSEEVLNLFAERKLLAVLQGHTHVNELIREGTVNEAGVSFITSGAVCGNWWCDAKEGNGEGFLVVEVEEDQVRFRYKRYISASSRDC